MNAKAMAALIAALLTVIIGCVGALGFGAGGAGIAACTAPLPGTAARPLPAVGNWDATQTALAAGIVEVGRELRVPPRGWIIAVATAMTESRLRNLGHQGADNDHDSHGLFQQRPSQGWGTPAQILDPRYAAEQFYRRLTEVDGWQRMALSVAAQRVQRSAYPDAYADFEDDAIAVVDAVSSEDGPFGWLGACAGLGGDGLSDEAAAQLPADFRLPDGTPPAVVAAINWALGQLGTPYTFGGDCTAAHSGNPRRQCDCSSLVQQSYRSAGVDLPRTTLQQVHAGLAVPVTGPLLAGDLIFIPGSDGTATRPRHVGLYLGGGLVIQAPRTGDVVKITGFARWQDSVAMVRRVVPQPDGAGAFPR